MAPLTIRYKEVPEWWFLCILLFAFVTGVAALEGWPTHTPWWSLLTVMILNSIFLVPSAILLASANVTFHTGVLFQMLAGIWFAGNPQAQIDTCLAVVLRPLCMECYLSSDLIFELHKPSCSFHDCHRCGPSFSQNCSHILDHETVRPRGQLLLQSSENHCRPFLAVAP